MAQTVFERMGGTPVRQGDYELPAVEVFKQEDTSVGIWGQWYRRWLKENYHVLYYTAFAFGEYERSNFTSASIWVK